MLLLSQTKNPLKSRIAFIVISIHLLFLFFIWLHPSYLPKTKNKHLVVKTFTAKSIEKSETAPPAKKIAAPPQPIKAPPPVQKTEPQKKPTPVAAKKIEQPKPAVVKKKEAVAPIKKATPTPAKPKASAAIPKDLLEELEESIAKIDQKQDKMIQKRKLEAPRSIGSLSVDSLTDFTLADSPFIKGGYKDALIRCLHESLHLPDYGEVKLQLTLAKDGGVVKVVVLRAESDKNKKYLELHLPKIKFPPLEEPFSKKGQHTFILTFCNEI